MYFSFVRGLKNGLNSNSMSVMPSFLNKSSWVITKQFFDKMPIFECVLSNLLSVLALSGLLVQVYLYLSFTCVLFFCVRVCVSVFGCLPFSHSLMLMSLTSSQLALSIHLFNSILIFASQCSVISE